MKKMYGNTDASISDREKKHADLARRAAEESFVLLENDGALPLQTKKIAPYGTGARRTVCGGTGSGEVQKRWEISIEQGLKNAGYEITTQHYLDDYDREYEESYRCWHESVEQEISGIQDPMQALMKALGYAYQFPAGRKITEEDITESGTDTAIYVLMRQAGEGNDRKLEEGDYFLTENERYNLKIVADRYKHTIVVINVGGMIDLSFMDEISGINALVFFVQGGMEGGNALAELLSGAKNFSGKLADTWYRRYKDIPGGKTYSYLDGNLAETDYTEGIYVGYRYCDTFGVQPRYPFGYGMSYTRFEINTEQVSMDHTDVKILIRVTNTGRYAGRHIVQVYLSCPSGKLSREYQSLAAFAKTGEIAPGESEMAELSFDLRSMAGYEEESARWILEPGEYILRVGDSSADTEPVCILTVEKEIVTEQCRRLCHPQKNIEEIRAKGGNNLYENMKKVPIDIRKIRVDDGAFSTFSHDYREIRKEESTEIKCLLDSLTIEEMAELVRGGDLQKDPEGIHNITGAVGRTAITLIHKGIRNVLFADGPAGLNLQDHIKKQIDGTEKPTEVPEKYRWGQAAKIMEQMKVAKTGQDIYRYATAWPVEELLAQSWDTALLEEIGRAVSGEMKEFGITLWLAPGMNIHRNPLCGRTFEYFSEDPLLSGKMAAALTRGVQNCPETGTVVKHFCANNQEDNRNYMSSNVSERALREIYLKGFEIAVKESRPRAVMSSYNKLNGIYTANNPELLNGILRGEWGYDGLVMTDWNSCGNTGNGDPALCVPSGNDLVMPGTEYDRARILQGLEEGILSEDELRQSAARVLSLVLKAGF